MSFIAEIHGKSPFHKFEDFLTSDVFAAIKYIPPHQGFVRFLRTIKGIDSIIPEPDKNTICSFYFWPLALLFHREPDKLLEHQIREKIYHIVVVVKYLRVQVMERK